MWCLYNHLDDVFFSQACFPDDDVRWWSFCASSCLRSSFHVKSGSWASHVDRDVCGCLSLSLSPFVAELDSMDVDDITVGVARWI